MSTTAAPAPAAAPVTTPTTAAKAPAAAPAATEPMHEIVVNGVTEKVALKDLIRYAQKGKHADKTVQQAKEGLKAIAEWKKQREAAESKEKADADELLRSRGHDPDAVARKKLEQRLREEEMTPEQRAVEKERLRAEAAEKKAKDLEDAANQAKAAEHAKVVRKNVEGHLAAAADRMGLKADGDAYAAIVDALQEYHDLGMFEGRQFSADDADRVVEVAAQKLEESFDRVRKGATTSLKGKALLDKLGPEVVAEVLRAKIELTRGGGGGGGGKPATTAAEKNTPDGDEYTNSAGFRARLRERVAK